MRLRPRGRTPTPDRDSSPEVACQGRPNRPQPWGLRGTSVTSVMCWTSGRPRSCRPWCRSTSTPRSRSGRATCSPQRVSRCRLRRCATRWPRSKPRATCSSRTRAPAACPPTRATASSSTRSRDRGPLDSPRAQQVRTFFAQAHGALEQMLSDTSRLLTRLTDHAAVVVGPPLEQATIRSVQLVGLSSRRRARRHVLSNGSIERQTIELGAELQDDQIAVASAHLARSMVGTSTSSRLVIPPTGDPAVDQLVDAAHAALSSSTRGSRAHLRRRRGAHGRGVRRRRDRALGAAHARAAIRRRVARPRRARPWPQRRDRLRARARAAVVCSVVVAPYEIDGEPAGTIGVLGPTRMNYPQALAAVAVVSKRLGQRLSEG